MAVTIKMTTSQRAKLAALGGAAWVREMIDRAKRPSTSKRQSGHD